MGESEGQSGHFASTQRMPLLFRLELIVEQLGQNGKH
jgi:hypothetical protein